MDAEYRGLGFDPAPGSPDAVRAAAGRCATAAGRLDAAAAAAEGTGRLPADWWTGAAATGFVAGLERIPAELASATGTLRAAEGILDDWAGTLTAHQRRADRLEHRALELRRALAAAAGEVDRAEAALQTAIGSAARAATERHAAAVARHDQLRGELDLVIEEARVLEREHLAAGQRVAERLHALAAGGVDAIAGLPEPDELFGQLATMLGSFAAQAGELAVSLLGPGAHGSPAVPPAGAAGRFAAALAGPPGAR